MQIEVIISFARVSLYQLRPQVRARMYSHRLHCIRNGIKKITIDLNQLKATHEKSFFASQKER